MRKEEIPQDPSALAKFTREVSYAVDGSGKYTTDLSQGWEVKASALDAAWDEISERLKNARERVMKGEASTLLFHMEKHLMDPAMLASYTRIWAWRVKRHLRPGPFAKLGERTLRKYAEVFRISIEQLKTLPPDEA